MLCLLLHSLIHLFEWGYDTDLDGSLIFSSIFLVKQMNMFKPYWHLTTAICHRLFNLPNTTSFNLYPTAFKLFFVLPVCSFPRDGPLNRWACLTTCLTIHVYKL